MFRQTYSRDEGRRMKTRTVFYSTENIFNWLIEYRTAQTESVREMLKNWLFGAFSIYYEFGITSTDMQESLVGWLHKGFEGDNWAFEKLIRTGEE